MKKLFITLLCLLALTTSCKQKSSETTGGESAEVAVAEGAAQNVTPQQLAEKWSEKAIAVKGGGEAPDVVTLLQAFSKVWSTQAVNNLLAEASDPNFTESVNTDIGAAITVDRENGFAELGAGDSDDDCMGAGVWKCDNGHLLFALNVVTTQTDRRDLAAHQALCCYDYDPKTEVMKPVENALTRYQPMLPNTTLTYRMPSAAGVMRVGEVDNKGEEMPIWHFLKWTGKDFVEYNCCTDLELEEKVMGVWVNFDKKEPAITFNISRSEEEGLTATDCGIYGSTEYDVWLSVFDGEIIVREDLEEDMTDEGEVDTRKPAFDGVFVLNREGNLVGNYYLRQNGGAEFKGNVVLQHGDPADALK